MAINRRPPKDNVRRIKNSGKNNRRTLVSQAHETIQCESTNEKKHYLTLLRDKKYLRIVSQPLVIPYKDSDGNSHTYTPDVMGINTENQIDIFEFTLAERKEQNREREIGARKFCSEKGYKYIVLNEFDLPSETQIANLDALIGFRALSYKNETIKELILMHLSDKHMEKIVTLIELFSQKFNFQKGDISNTIYHMLWHDELKTDLEQLLIMDGEPNWKQYVWMD